MGKNLCAIWCNMVIFIESDVFNRINSVVTFRLTPVTFVKAVFLWFIFSIYSIRSLRMLN